MPPEELQSTVELPTRSTARRPTAGESASRLLNKAGSVVTLEKLTTRVYGPQNSWLKTYPRDYRSRHPMKPKLTTEELTRIAVQSLMDAEDVEAVIAKYRS